MTRPVYRPEIPITDDDDWETDPEISNPVNEQEQRRGAATLPVDDRKAFKSIDELRQQVIDQDNKVREEAYKNSGYCVAHTYQGPSPV